MSKRKKTFPCGHVGYGQFCHACKQEEAQRQERRAQKDAWEAAFESDPIDLRHLPKHVVCQAREVLDKLASGTYWGELGGKRLQHDREVVSIPVTRDYRLVCKIVDNKPVPVEAVSHEDYNKKRPGA